MIRLSKYHSYGNDFLILRRDHSPDGDPAAFSKAVCDPHFGIGADGCVLVTHQKPFELRIFNRDGSEASMSGNGARCVSAFLHHHKLHQEPEVLLKTVSGPKRHLLVSNGPYHWDYQSWMGQPGFEPSQVPCLALDQAEIRRYPLQLAHDIIEVDALSVGNPQCVVFVPSLPDDSAFHRLGSQLEAHPFFPHRTNVSFVEKVSDHHLKIRIWERGVGPTHSSGTGSCGAAVAAIRAKLVHSPVTVETATGAQQVAWEPGAEIELTGAVEFIAEIKIRWPLRPPERRASGVTSLGSDEWRVTSDERE